MHVCVLGAGVVGLAIVLGANKVSHLFGQQGVLS